MCSTDSTAHRHEFIKHRVEVRRSAPSAVRSLMGLLTLLAGCAPLQPLVINEPIGPLTWTVDESRGSLIVYSYTESSSLDPADSGPRSDYTLHTARGEFLRVVNNRDSSLARDPVTLDLPVGQYQVTARAANFELVTVSVAIQGGRLTLVDLTQDVLAHATASNGNWVRLPNGQVIGSTLE